MNMDCKISFRGEEGRDGRCHCACALRRLVLMRKFRYEGVEFTHSGLRSA